MMASAWHMVSVGFLLSSLSASPTPALSFFPSFLANSSGYGVRERTRCCRIQTMRGQPPPGDSGMEKAISNQLWVGRQSARPCPESPGVLSAGSSGSHTNCGPTPASSGLQTPGLTRKGGPREAHLSHPEPWGYWGPQQLTVTCSPACLLTSITQGQPGGGVTYLLVPGPVLGMSCSFLLGSVRVPYSRSA